MILGRLRGLFHRYADRHLKISLQSFDLRGPNGEAVGHVDRVCRVGRRLEVEGWARAGRVTLVSGAMQSSAVPELRRDDVAAALGGSPEVGFALDLAFQDSPPQMFLSFDGGEVRQPLPEPTPGQYRRAVHRLRWRFLWLILSSSSDILGWRLRRDPACRARIKRRLDLDPQRQAGPLETRIFEPDTARKPVPDGTRITIVLPVYNAFHLLPEVLERVERHSRLDYHLLILEDGSTDERVRPFLRDWAAGRTDRVSLLENPRNLGFIGSVNRGLEQALERGDHVVLLNSDALVPADWDIRLLRSMLDASDVASVTPMSNDAEIFSVPAICRRCVLLPGEGDAIDRAAQRIGSDLALAEAPTGVGFCMAMHVDYLRRVPRLDTAFGRGYGEEVDWCQKTRALGGRHLGLPALFVEHRGGESFGSEDKLKLVLANNAIVAERYPGYDAEVQEFIRADPLLTARLALALAWAGARAAEGLPIYLAHSLGGGAEHYLESRIASDLEQSGAALVLRVGGLHRWQIELHTPQGVTSGMVSDFAFVETLLDPVPVRHVVYSCGVGDPDPLALPGLLAGLKRGPQDRIEVLFHDFFPVSPSYCLLDRDGVFRGAVTAERDDPAHQPRRGDGSHASLAEWQAAWGGLIAAADRVTVFSQSSRDLVLASYPQAAAALAVQPHRMRALPQRVTRSQPGAGEVLAVLGNIGYQKGAAVIADLAQRMTTGGGTHRLVLIGNIDPAYALPGSVVVHGSYRPQEIGALAAHYGITAWLIPSIWPETFSFTIREALATGLPVHAFDLGAQGEAAAAAENGRVIPFGAGSDPVTAILQALEAPHPETEASTA
ncbi:MAG: glycosyl transferase [Pelagibaca sp.]|nr:glycosyl transferase [Pelagibaca sp.]